MITLTELLKTPAGEYIETNLRIVCCKEDVPQVQWIYHLILDAVKKMLENTWYTDRVLISVETHQCTLEYGKRLFEGYICRRAEYAGDEPRKVFDVDPYVRLSGLANIFGSHVVI